MGLSNEATGCHANRSRFEASARVCWSFTKVAARFPTTRNGSRSLVACVMTAQSRSTPNTARLALGSARSIARDKRDAIRHASSIDHDARRPHAPACLQRAPGQAAGQERGCVAVRELIYISLWIGLSLGSVWAFDPGPYIVVSAAAGTFTAFAAVQQLN